MKHLIYLFIALIITSCQTEQKSEASNTTPSKQKKSEEETRPKGVTPQHSKNILPDFFPISDTAFSQFKKDPSQWFMSDDGKTRLYLAPYTDYSITTAVLTSEALHDPELIQLFESESIQINDLSKSIPIGKIVSEKGIYLGQSYSEILMLFGTSIIKQETDHTITRAWHFNMLEDTKKERIGNLRPFIIQGLEFVIEMTFVDDKLTKLVYQYAVP